jgi:hypothetical protein
MILIVGDNGFSNFSLSDGGQFLTAFGNLLSHESFKEEEINEIIIVNFKDRLSITQSLLNDFFWIPTGDIEKVDMKVKQSIEQIIKKARIISSDKLTDYEFFEEMKFESVRFLDMLFPIEFIDLYRKLPKANAKLFILEEKTFIDDRPDRAELFIKQIEKIKPIFDSFKEWTPFINFISFLIVGYFDEKNGTKYSTSFAEVMLKNYNKYIELNSSSSKSSFSYEILLEQRMDYFFEILSTQKKDVSDLKYRKEFAQDLINSEFFTEMVKDLDVTKPEEINDLRNEFYESFTQEPTQEERIRIAKKAGAVFRKNLASQIPEYLFEMLKKPSCECFKDLEHANSRIIIALGEDLDFIRYLVSDALRDYSIHSKKFLDASDDDLDFQNIKADFLVIEEFESLPDTEQKRLWDELLMYKNNFKSVIFCCNKERKLKKSIMGNSRVDKAEIPSYEDLKKERYKIFLHLLNRKKPINRKAIDAFVAAPFHNREFDSYLDGVESFPIMVNILDKFDKEMDEFTYDDLLEPFFWYSFEIYHEEASGVIAEEIKTERAYDDKPGRYRIVCRDKSWEVYLGQKHIMQVEHIDGFDFMFYLLWYESTLKNDQQKDGDKKKLKRIAAGKLYYKLKKESLDDGTAQNRINRSWGYAKRKLAEQLNSKSELLQKKYFIEYLMELNISKPIEGVAVSFKKRASGKDIQIEVEFGNYFET